MKLPIRRHDDGAEKEFERLRDPFAAQLDRWPDFLAPLHSLIDAATPLADLEETDDAYLLDVELPGVDRRDVELHVADGRLVLTAQRRERERIGLLRHRTRTTGRIALALSLPGSVQEDAVTADLSSGVLSVVVPKAEHARRRRIPISSRR